MVRLKVAVSVVCALSELLYLIANHFVHILTHTDSPFKRMNITGRGNYCTIYDPRSIQIVSRLKQTVIEYRDDNTENNQRTKEQCNRHNHRIEAIE